MIVKKLNTNVLCVQKENGGRIRVLRPQDSEYTYWHKKWLKNINKYIYI